jgi:predicted nucleic acid-binding protein
VTFFVDANVIVYSATPGPYRTPCTRLLEVVASGRSGGRTSPAVLEEVWFLELTGKVGDLEGLTAHVYSIFKPLLEVTDQAFDFALAMPGRRLGSADRLHAGTCRSHGVRSIVTADAGFDEVRGLRRVDPLDVSSMQRVLDIG